MRRTIRMAWRAGWLLVLLAGGIGVASAQRVEGDRAAARGVYQAEVSVRSQAESERHAGFARALAQVLGKLSGDRGAAARPGVDDEMRRAGDYVDGYDYRQDEGVSAVTGAPTYDTTLIVRFDRDKVDDIAAALGLPVWPQPRPKPVLWLAIDDGSGPRLVGLPKAEAARSVLDRALERGYRLGLPAGSAAEQAAVGAIWRGDTGAIARISARYSPPLQLIGKLRRGNGGWVADWIFVDHGKVLARWSDSDRSARRAMAAGADGAADALARRYAKVAPIGPPGRYLVRFTGLDSSQDYLRLSAWLQDLSVVRGITPVRATPEALDLELELTTGVAGLRRLLDDELLEADGADEPPRFRLR
ncbi:DUF2066 domain-containing protein [Cognatiluteimonas weifangensis]|uniref:DUF2066 domain-containing protein n=1 Tax=Cognatiluteimonas weifangensis TaxID=2303539 RepID=A0A372DSX5_9GAMM|nr:DUF2066 domain-containing protein [Luteimonas weifangensis]RFP62422.1 DUF2066 domain-containing protein [Luteimonas weifangensis]